MGEKKTFYQHTENTIRGLEIIDITVSRDHMRLVQCKIQKKAKRKRKSEKAI